MSDLIKNTLKKSDSVITDLKRTPGGVTNISYFVTVNGEELVVRIPGKGTIELIDRRNEKNNLIFGTKLGINPELIYFDEQSGLKITRKIKDPTLMTPQFARERKMTKQIIALFKHLHQSKIVMKNRFELFTLIFHYENLVKKENTHIIEKLFTLKKDVLALKKVYDSFQVTEVPCHIDSGSENIILGENGKLFLIDWEYSGMFDPLWDIATFFLSVQFTEEEEMFFLQNYLKREPTNEEKQRIMLHKIFQDYLWCLWSFYKEKKADRDQKVHPDEYGAYGQYHIRRAKENINLYHRLYN